MFRKGIDCQNEIHNDAAAAIEEFQAEVDKANKSADTYRTMYFAKHGDITIEKVRELDEIDCHFHSALIRLMYKRIEELEAKNKELHGRIEDKELQIDMLTADNTNYEIAIDELKAQLPKRGEWVWKHRHHGGLKTAKGKCECGRDVYAQIDERYETDDPYCPFCGVINDSIHLNYCPNCGADMRKMEVQDG
jgi:hypothetical protein